MSNREYVIVSDGSCDLPDALVAQNHIVVVPFYVATDGKNFQKENAELSVTTFYQTISENPSLNPKTTLPSVGDYQDAFTKILEEGKDIICICITSKFSGSYNSALVAKEYVMPKFKDAKITIIDSMVNTGVQGLLVLELARMKKDGIPYEKAIEIVQKMKTTGRIFFTIGNMDYLRKGGRIGKLKGLVGATLKIKPIIVLKEGEIFSGGLAFTRAKAILKATKASLDYFKETKEKPEEYRFITGYGLDEEEGKNFNQKIKDLYHLDDVIMIQIGAAIGVHTGPLPLGVGFIKKYENFI